MTTLFSKGKISRFLLYPIMATFFFLLYELVSVVIATYYCSLDFYLILHYEPLIIFCNEIGKCLGILIEIYVIKKRTKDKIFFKSELKKSGMTIEQARSIIKEQLRAAGIDPNKQ